MKFDLKQFLAAIAALAPLLQFVKGADKIAPFLPVIISGITEAEQIPGATGPAKRAHVLKLVDTGVTVTNATGKVKLDPAEVQAIAGNIVDTAVSITKVVQGAKVVPPQPGAVSH